MLALARTSARIMVVLAVVGLAPGCAGRCEQVAAARKVLQAHPTGERPLDVRMIVPLARANELLAALLVAQPVTMPLAPPHLGPLTLPSQVALTAVARAVQLRPGPPGKVRFALQVEVRDGAEPLTTLAMLAEVTPVLRRDGAKADLEMQFGLGNLLAIKPQLDLPTPTALTRAVARWLPASMRSKVPPSMLAAAAEELGAYLLGAAYQRVRATLLPRLGEVTRLRLHLPEVPVASVAVRSLWADPASGERASLEPLAESVTFAPAPSPDALAIEILTDLPVRRGLPPPRSAVVPSDISIALSVSAAAELGTWAIEHGLLPRWYSRGLKPSDRGEFRPRLDYVAEDRAHPFKVHLFQERGGCSYFRVGVRASIAMEGPALVVSTSDRVLEQVVAAPLLEVAAWVKYVLTGWIDESKRVVARTQLSIGPQSFATEVVGALLADDQLEFSLRLTPAPAPAPRLR